MNRTDRLLAIILELQAKGWQRAEDLAATFEISKRTIYRDVQALCESGVPIMASPGQGYSLIEGYFLPPLSFNTDEAIILLLGADFMAQNFDAQYRLAARSSASKIQAVLPDKLRDDVRDLQISLRFIAMNPLDNPQHTEMLHQLRRAIIQRRTIHIEYHTRYSDNGEAKNSRDADPYALVHIDKAWYLVAYCHLRRDVRNFRLDRIDHLRLLDKTFTRPPDFTVSQREDDDRFICVRALFNHDIARWVREERSFYAVDESDHPNGLLMTFYVRHETDLLNWLLGWGAGVHVLEPESLRRRMADAAQAILKNHESLLP